MAYISHYVGSIDLNNGRVLVSDPCTSGLIAEVKRGVYNCFMYTGEYDTSEPKHIWLNQISLAFTPDSDYVRKHLGCSGDWEKIGSIDVASSLAGYFPRKPNFTCKEWAELCTWMFDDSVKHTLMLEQEGCGVYLKDIDGAGCFWTCSGKGDGTYDVYALRNPEGEIIALETRF